MGSDLRLNHIACPHCGVDLTFEPSQAGSASICPECEGNFQSTANSLAIRTEGHASDRASMSRERLLGLLLVMGMVGILGCGPAAAERNTQLQAKSDADFAKAKELEAKK